MSPAAPILHSKYNVFIEKFLSDSKNKGQNPVTCYVKRGNGICLTYFILIDIHSMQAGIPVGTFLQKMETIFVKVVSCEKNWNMLQ